MKAAIYRAYGPPDVLRIEEVPKPSPGDEEVLVRVHAATVVAPDWRFRRPAPFLIRAMNGLTRPKITILGMEVAGVVEAVGANVTRFAAGDEVFGSAGTKFGAHAEYVCVAAGRGLERKPANLSFEEAAPLSYAGVTALHFLRQANIKPGQRVLIYGASGAVGTASVQIAKRHFGAHVTGVCSGANLDLVRSIGADDAIDYTKDDFSRAGRVYDVIMDTVGYSGFSRSLRALKRGGIYLLVDAGPEAMLAGVWVSATSPTKVISGVALTKEGDLALLRELAEAGKLKPVIGRRYSLEQIAEAHAYAESGRKVGNAVVVLAT
ncbi:MAG TPA: NAD(P)-dependent alcohol dehydrogenase [Hyphomonadaceae bacterium]|nr:NAD(P)-dependent alcohol dehydrogenase [Hyphomonadaceae bacterium]